jgi:L-rhamnose-H+ transport protein
MTRSFWLGMVIISVSGIFNGTFALPMKYSRHWRWENTWLLFSLFSLVVLPWVLAVRFVPNLWAVYANTPIHVLFFPLGFGLLLGIAQVTYGLGIASVGIAIAIAIVSGVSCVSGALVPLIFLQPAELFRPRGVLLLVSMAILLVGLTLYSMAGRRRESEQSGVNSGTQAFKWGFGTGLAICIFTGVFGSSINLGFAFSGEIIHNSIEHGGNAVTSTYGVWALLFGASFIANLVYCSHLLFRNHAWSLFLGEGWTKEVAFVIGMALLSFGAFIGYGVGAMVMGKYGTSVGWALFVAATIIASSLAGMVMGEWKNTSQRTHRLLLAAVTVMLASVVTLVLSGLL